MNPVFLSLTSKVSSNTINPLVEEAPILVNLSNVLWISSDPMGETHILMAGGKGSFRVKEAVAQIENMIAEKTALSKDS